MAIGCESKPFNFNSFPATKEEFGKATGIETEPPWRVFAKR
jgi:hypothetical protein